jgi:putative copper resistance protein D
VIAAAGLIASRFLHYAALTILFGVAAFPLYNGQTPAPSGASAFFAWSRRVQITAAAVALVSGFAWLGFVATTMSGNLASLFDGHVLWLVISTTDFGGVWAPHLGLILLALLLLLPKEESSELRWAVLALSAVALTSIADTGHSGAENGPRAGMHIAADAAHLLSAGVWIGALAVLTRMVVIAMRRNSDDDLKTLNHSLLRFSGIGPAVVAVLMLSGIYNPGFLSSLSSTYGQVLLAKLLLFVIMLALAAANRFWLTARLGRAMQSGTDLQGATQALKASIFAETALAALVLMAVGWLGTLAPPPGH